ncbi:MAG: DUF4249 domain-containing protein [Sphingobacteriaceae bacterium]|nr:MAG: DUF4249 domain-containing protein [Sphingobacteriaceae bacterium]
MKHPVYPVIAIFAVLLFQDCKKTYKPETVAESNNILVVEGIINSGNDSTFIKLSRTVKLDAGRSINAETGATITVEAENGTGYVLNEISNGVYAASPLPIDKTQKYRLHILTGGNEYLSDYVEVKTTPELQDIGFKVNGDKVNVTVNTADATNSTRYYRWEYNQTWEFNANYLSDYKYVNHTLTHRVQNVDYIYHCWADEKTASIALGSSVRLSQDIIKDHTILSIPGTSEKLGIKYSILVKQYALTKDAFDFWQNLKKNTEQLGTIFDPMPSQTKGNIYNVANPAEQIIGYVSASSVTTKRAFVSKSNLTQFISTPFYTDCRVDTADDKHLDFHFTTGKGPYIPLLLVEVNDKEVLTMALSKCADCTLRGTTKRPDFWE